MKIKSKLSKQPRKMRKRFLYDAPLHVKQRMMVAPLAPEAREKYGIRRFRVRVGDKVKVRKPITFKDTIGKITKVDIKRLRIYVENVTRKRGDGSTVQVPLRPWNVEILELDLSDPKRKKALERKAKIIEVEEKIEEEEIEEEAVEEEEEAEEEVEEEEIIEGEEGEEATEEIEEGEEE